MKKLVLMLFIALFLSFLFLVDYANAACVGKNYEFRCGDLNTRGCEVNLAQGEAISFTVKGQKHVLQVDGMNENSLTLWIWSKPIRATISIGETEEFDLDKNNYNDFALTLSSITNGKANMVLKSLSETAPSA
ncbi:MAG: hypothetical protein K6T16_03005 [Candidatus Pacearchaeota archaeon]|nr:hypothetical protein [Candidatus Pacearchaeota archaeon]